MSTFIAAYVTNSSGKEFPLCIEKNTRKCKERFCEWYMNVDYNDISVRYAPVKVTEHWVE